MASSQRWSYRLARLVILFVGFQHLASSINLEYCSSLNTANTPANSSIFQSNGLCYQFCIQDYAFAVLQDSECWCSDYAPADTSDTSDCNTPCPGYPDDLCGGSHLFGYIALTMAPSGTVGGSRPSSTISRQVPSVPQPVTITATLTASASSPSTLSSTTSTTSTTSSTTSSSTSTTSSSSSTWTATPVISLETVTGQLKTVTVTPTVPPSASSLTDVKKSSGGGGGLSTGGAVGLTVGLVALVAIVAALVYFWLRKRRQDEIDEKELTGRGGSSGMAGPIPSRTMSENSRYVLGTDGRQVVETWEPTDAPGSRRSRLMPVDPRLDPFAPVYQRGDGNRSRESVNTIRDDHDYSRRVHQQGPILRATNPD